MKLGIGMNLLPEMWTYAEYISHRFRYLNATGKLYDPLVEEVFLYIPFFNNEDFAVVMEKKDKIIIAFSGTKNCRAWISNFDPYPLGEGMIHDGFYTAWSYFKDAFDRYFRDNFDVETKNFSGIKKDIWITGHSRGGALASLCARHFAKNRHKTVACMTFGAPAQGTCEYVDQYKELFLDHTRVINGYDIVPEMPSRNLGFYHQMSLIHLPQPRWHKWFHKVRDHFYSNYTKAIMMRCISWGDTEGVKQMKRVLKRAKP